MMIDRRLIAHFDWTLLGVVISIAIIGIINLYSITSNSGGIVNPLYAKQIAWFLLGLSTMLIVAFIEYRYYSDFAYIIYSISVFLLLLLLVYGIVSSGAQRWFKIGWFFIQPSEFVKISLILSMAKIFQKPPKKDGYSLSDLPLPLLILIVPTFMILKQPDLGTAIIIVLIFFSILIFVRVRWSSLLVLGLGGLSLMPIMWGFLKDYQRRRILTFLNPDLDPLGTGYHLIQSKISIGSGGLLGKGFMKGTQCKLGFLPEQHTDFIFSAFCEEWGFLGSIFLLSLYTFVIIYGLHIAVQSKDRFGAILSFGVVAMLFWHTFINMAMVLGMIPVVGVPLPFFSYGGSFLLSALIGVGLLLNVSMRRFLF